MADYQIPCEALARLASLCAKDKGPWLRCIRYDNGVLVATNGLFLAAEHVSGSAGVFHIIPDPAFIEQCRVEGAHGGQVTISLQDAIKWATATTTFGYSYPGNAVEWSDEPNPHLGQWRERVALCKEQPAGDGAMFINMVQCTALIASSPSGAIVFEDRMTLTGRPTLVRDPYDANWCGVFQPWPASDQSFAPATYPAWLD